MTKDKLDMSQLDEIKKEDKYDQYTQFERLPILLKRFSFEEKMSIAALHSSRAILFGKDIKTDQGNISVLPWCLETFVMLSIEAREYSDGKLSGKEESKFIKMCNAIWDATSVAAQTECGNFSFMDTFFAVTGLSQFQMQEHPLISQYRYWHIFNDDSTPLNLKDVFKKKMGTDYEEYLLLGYVLQIIFIAYTQSNLRIPQNLLFYLLFERFQIAAKNLTISREDYIKLQQQYADGSNDPYKYVYSLRPSYQYAFIREKGKIFFPLPHLLNRNITSALLYRVTDGDNSLRTSIGKNVLEKYLFDLLKESSCYDEVFPEQRYIYNNSEAKSPDILASEGEDILFLDSKSTVPSMRIRLFDVDDFNKNINIVAENIEKLYKQIRRFELYNPFRRNGVNDIEKQWGIIVVLEDTFIHRKHYFEKAAELLDIKKDSKEWEWLINHIKVIDFYTVERISLGGNSLIDAFKESLSSEPFNYNFLGVPQKKSGLNSKSFSDFRNMLDEKALAIIDELKTSGLIM